MLARSRGKGKTDEAMTIAIMAVVASSFFCHYLIVPLPMYICLVHAVPHLLGYHKQIRDGPFV